MKNNIKILFFFLFVQLNIFGASFESSLVQNNSLQVGKLAAYASRSILNKPALFIAASVYDALMGDNNISDETQQTDRSQSNVSNPEQISSNSDQTAPDASVANQLASQQIQQQVVDLQQQSVDQITQKPANEQNWNWKHFAIAQAGGAAIGVAVIAIFSEKK